VVELHAGRVKLLAALVPAKHTATYDRMCQSVYNEPCDLAYRHCIQIIGSRLRKRCGLTIPRPALHRVRSGNLDGGGQRWRWAVTGFSEIEEATLEASFDFRP